MSFENAPAQPSPTASSPGLTQPTSNSSSSPQPLTPPRQPRPRYPDLGRVPLHRRGTSQTYERLEDLLREAGYKETRVFTPESDRLESQKHSNDASHPAEKKQGVGAAVVGFLTGLVTGGTGTTTQARQQPPAEDIPDHHLGFPRTQSPSSPLAGRRPHLRETSHSAESSEPHTPLMTSSIESLGDSTPKALRRYPHQPPSRPTTPGANAPAAYATHYHQHQYHTPLATQQQHRLSAAQRCLQKQASKTSFHTHTSITSSSALNASSDQGATPIVILNDNNNNAVNDVHQPKPSRAGAYLRHMVSTPTINPPPRPKSTPIRTQHPRKRTIHEDSDATDAESTTTVQPPLPRKWLDHVAKALLLNVAITSLSSPSSPTESTHDANISSSSSSFLHPDHHHRILRPTRSSLSQTTLARSSKPAARRSGLSDQTNASIHTVLNPPALFTRLERGRAPSSQSVLKAQVVCRSAPGSRTPSLVRQTGMSGNSHRIKGDKSVTGGGKSGQKQRSPGAKAESRVRANRRNNKKQDEEKTHVPSLARTRIVGDAWYIASAAPPRRNNGHPNKRSRSKDKLRADCFSDGDYMYDHPHSTEDDEDFYASDNDEDDDDDDDEGELDLARMLTHPKRQNSIRSLRRHLHLQLTSPSATDIPPTFTTTKPHHPSQPGLRKGSGGGGRLSSAAQARLGGMEEETDGTTGEGEQWEHRWRRGNSRRASEDDDEADGLPWLCDSGSNGGSQRSTSTKVRSPGPWNNAASMR